MTFVAVKDFEQAREIFLEVVKESIKILNFMKDLVIKQPPK